MLIAVILGCISSSGIAAPLPNDSSLIYPRENRGFRFADTTLHNRHDSTAATKIDTADEWHVDSLGEWYSDSMMNVPQYQTYDDTVAPVSLLQSRFSLGLAFGIVAIAAPDIANYINQELSYTAITPHAFSTSAGLSSSLAYNVSQALDVAIDYSFVTNSYSLADGNGYAAYSYDLHAIGLGVHRLFNHDDYGIAAGGGVGEMFGIFRQTLPNSNVTQFGYASGETMYAEMVLRGAFSEHLFLHTEFHGFVIFSGGIKSNGALLTSANAATPPIQSPVTFDSLGGSIDIGLDYFF